MMDYYGWPMMGYGFGYGGFGFLFWLVPILVVVLILVALFGRGERRFEEHDSGRALSILKERYAKGEITKEEFEKMKKDLS